MSKPAASLLRNGKARAEHSRRRIAKQFNPLARESFSRTLRFESLECRTLLSVVASAPNWVPEGPVSISYGTAAHEVGAINQIAVDPNPMYPTHLLAATVNGGIWQTQDFTATGGPTWTTTTDLLPSLSIECVAFSPVNSSVIYAGTGQYSSAITGDAAVGVYKSTDGGTTWQVENPDGMFNGLRIIRIVPTNLNRGQTVFLATTDSTTTKGKVTAGGVYRSDDGGTSWNRLSGTGILPNSGVTDLVENPANANQFFAAIPESLAGILAGVYELDASNNQWTPVDTGLAVSDLDVSTRIVLSISPAANPNPASANPIWAAIINSFDYQRVYQGVAGVQTVNWTPVGVYDPSTGQNLPPDVLNGNGPTFHGAIVADPQNDTLVYLDGTVGPVVRGDSTDNTNTWTAIGKMNDVPRTPPTGTAVPIDNGDTTFPHQDYRGLAFADGFLIDSDDGGVYQCTDPSGMVSGAQTWTSINGTIQDTEGADVSYNGSFFEGEGATVAYDQQFQIIFGGAQDVGTPTQNAQDNINNYVDQNPGDDGGDTAVDNFSLASQSPVESVRYVYGHVRMIYKGTNSRAPLDYNAFIFPEDGLSGFTRDAANDLFNFSVQNSVAGQIVAAGDSGAATVSGGALYESSNAGSAGESQGADGNYYVNDTWTLIATPSFFGQATAMAYGGRLNRVADPDVLYVAAQYNSSAPQIYLRMPGGTLTKTANLPADAKTITNIALDPNNWQTAFASDGTHVYMTIDAGASWHKVTGNLTNTGSLVTRINMAVIPGSGVDAVLFAGAQGVSRLLVNVQRILASDQYVWTRFGANLPNTETAGLVYNVHDDVLVVSTIGRGFWEVQNASTVAFASPVLYVNGDNSGGNTISVQLDPANANLLEIVQDGHLEFEAPTWAIPDIDIDLSNGNNDTIDIENVPTGVHVSIEGVAGDTVNIQNSSQGLWQGILGTIDVTSINGGMTLNVDDTGDKTARTVTMQNTASPANSGSISRLAQGMIDYAYSAVANLCVATDASASNSIDVLDTGVPTTLVIDAATNVTLGGDPTEGTQGINADVSIKNQEDGRGDNGDASISVIDLPGVPGTATVSVFLPTITKTDAFGIPVSYPDTPWGSISGLCAGTINYEFADTNGVEIQAPAGEQLVDPGNPVPHVTLHDVFNIQRITPIAPLIGGFEPLVIYGDNLADADGVLLGDGTFVPLSSPPSFDPVTQQWEVMANVPVPSTPGMLDLMVRTSTGDVTAPQSFSYLVSPVVTSIAPAVGPLSNPGAVAIFGTDLNGATAVDFGQNAGTIASIIQTDPPADLWEIVAIPPNATTTGTVDVTVTTPGGTSATSPNDEFTYTAAPIINTVYPQKSALAGGLQVSITGSGLDKVTEVDFGTTRVTNFTIAGDSQISVVSPPGTAGTVDVTVVSAGGTSPIVTNDQYTYLAPPAVTSVTQNSGSVQGGDTVTIQGTNLSSVLPQIYFGSTAGTILSDNGTLIKAITPAHAIGQVDVTVATTGGTSAIVAGDKYNFVVLPPVVSAISPAFGQVGGGTRVTITGTNLLGATEVDFGGVPGTIVAPLDAATQIVASSPPGSAGVAVDVTVVTAAGRSATSAADDFTYEPLPSVSSLRTSSGPVGGGTTVIITGSNLLGATEVEFGGVAGTIVPGTDTYGLITVISPAGAAGLSVDVTVVTSAGTSAATMADRFNYYVPGPVVSGLSTRTGLVGEQTPVTISGDYLSNASAVYFGTALATIQSDTDRQIMVLSPIVNTSGTVDVTVVAAGITSPVVPADEFTYGGVPNIYALVRPTGGGGDIGPANLSNGSWEVDILGVNLGGATEVDFGGNPVTSFLSDSSTEIVLAIPDADPGAVPVTVTTPFGTSAALQYTFDPGPVVIDLNGGPEDGPTAGNTSVTIRGVHLADAMAVNFGSTTITSFVYTDYGSGFGAITVTNPPGAAGTVDVTVTSPEGTSSTAEDDQFTYWPVPAVTGVSPALGPTVGGNTVGITGTGLGMSSTGAVTVDFGGVAAGYGSYLDGNPNTVYINAPPGMGSVDVTVTTPGGTSAMSPADQYNYVYIPSPTVSALSPSSGALTGGTPVTIYGAGLGNATAVDFGGVAATSFTNNGDGTITADSPSGIVGAVDVTVATIAGTSAMVPADQFAYVPPPVVTALDTITGSVGGGTQVTLTGSNLAGATEVDFGANSATIVSNIDDLGVDTLVLLSPEATADTPETVDVTVTTPYGATTDYGAFTYWLSPAVTALSVSVGPAAGGTPVTISGMNLAGATEVDFGGVAVSFMDNGDGTLSTVSPTSNVSTVDVTVVTPGGTTAISLADQFTYLAVPSVLSLSPAAGPLSGGTSVTISGTALANATEVDFDGVPTTFSVNPDGTITAVSPDLGYVDTGTADVTVVTDGGTSAPSSADLFTYAATPAVSGISPSWGNSFGGDIVTISGTDLDSATAVDFGGVAGTITYDSPMMIQAASPAGAPASVGVTVVGPGGTSATLPVDQFLYIGAPLATADTYAASENTPLNVSAPGVLANDSDPQGDTLTADLLASPANGVVSLGSDGSFTYTPNSGFFGADAFVYQADNGYLTSQPTLVTISVYAPTLSLSPSSGQPGSSFNAAFAGFAAAETISLSFNGVADGSATSDASGDCSTAASVPTNLPGGMYTVVAAGSSGDSASASFTVTPALALSPSSGSPGSTFTALVSGFAADETVDLSFNGVADGSATANAAGDCTVPATVPALATGTYTVTAEGQTSGASASASFNVTPAPGLTWDGTASGNWTDPHWVGGGPAYPNATANATVDTASVVQVTSAQAAQALAVTDSGAVAVAAGGSLAVTGDTSVTGGAALSVDPNGSFSTGGTFTLDTGGSVTGGPIFATAYQLNDGTASANLSGPGGVTKDTGGTVILSGSNAYAGSTVVNDGTFIVTNASALPDGTSLTIGAGATFIFGPSANATPATASVETTTAYHATSAETSSVTTSSSASPSAVAVVVKHSTSGRNPQSPIVPPAASQPPQSVPVVALSIPAADRLVRSSTASKIAGDMAWLGQAANSSDNSDQQRKKDIAILALDAVFAQYGP